MVPIPAFPFEINDIPTAVVLLVFVGTFVISIVTCVYDHWLFANQQKKLQRFIGNELAIEVLDTCDDYLLYPIPNEIVVNHILPCLSEDTQMGLASVNRNWLSAVINLPKRLYVDLNVRAANNITLRLLILERGRSLQYVQLLPITGYTKVTRKLRHILQSMRHVPLHIYASEEDILMFSDNYPVAHVWTLSGSSSFASEFDPMTLPYHSVRTPVALCLHHHSPKSLRAFSDIRALKFEFCTTEHITYDHSHLQTLEELYFWHTMPHFYRSMLCDLPRLRTLVIYGYRIGGFHSNEDTTALSMPAPIYLDLESLPCLERIYIYRRISYGLKEACNPELGLGGSCFTKETYHALLQRGCVIHTYEFEPTVVAKFPQRWCSILETERRLQNNNTK